MTPAAGPALDRDGEVKRQLRLDPSFADMDDTLAALIAVATDVAQKHTARALVTQKWRQYFDGFPGCHMRSRHERYFSLESRHSYQQHFELMRSPCVSVNAIKYLDICGEEQTLDPALYDANIDLEPATIRRSLLAVWPPHLRADNSVWVEYTAGYGDTPATVPVAIRQGMLMLISHWYENAVPIQDVPFAELPFAVTTLFDMNRVWYS